MCLRFYVAVDKIYTKLIIILLDEINYLTKKITQLDAKIEEEYRPKLEHGMNLQ